MLLITSNRLLAQVGINTKTVYPSAALEISSEDNGLLLPRLNESQINSIIKPVKGLLIHCTNCSTKGIYVHNGISFHNISEPHSEITNFPTDNKFYKRQKNTNSATINIEGTVSSKYGFNSVNLEVYKNNVLTATLTQNLEPEL